MKLFFLPNKSWQTFYISDNWKMVKIKSDPSTVWTNKRFDW